MFVALATPAYADDLGDFIHKITNGPVARVKHEKGRAHVPHHGGPTHIMSLVDEISAAHHIRPRLVHAIIRKESRYNCAASSAGSMGIMQVKKGTAASVGVHGNLFDCRTGLEAGVGYLEQAIKRYGDGCAAISAYNAGLGNSRCTRYGRSIIASQ